MVSDGSHGRHYNSAQLCVERATWRGFVLRLDRICTVGPGCSSMHHDDADIGTEAIDVAKEVFCFADDSIMDYVCSSSSLRLGL